MALIELCQQPSVIGRIKLLKAIQRLLVAFQCARLNEALDHSRELLSRIPTHLYDKLDQYTFFLALKV
jgi:hypothetical protein